MREGRGEKKCKENVLAKVLLNIEVSGNNNNEVHGSKAPELIWLVWRLIFPNFYDPEGLRDRHIEGGGGLIVLLRGFF